MRLWIAGDGPLREALQAEATRLGLIASLDFLGARRDVPQLLQGADALVMTSITEGQPMALLEAMAAGLPCIATEVGGIPGLLNNGAGLLVPSRDPVAVAQRDDAPRPQPFAPRFTWFAALKREL